MSRADVVTSLPAQRSEALGGVGGGSHSYGLNPWGPGGSSALAPIIEARIGWHGTMRKLGLTAPSLQYARVHKILRRRNLPMRRSTATAFKPASDEVTAEQRYHPEAALAEAYGLDPEGTLAALQHEADAAGSRLEAIADGADRHPPAGRLKQAIREHRRAVAALGFVEAIAAGQPADPIPVDDDDPAELVRRY